MEVINRKLVLYRSTSEETQFRVTSRYSKYMDLEVLKKGLNPETQTNKKEDTLVQTITPEENVKNQVSNLRSRDFK